MTKIYSIIILITFFSLELFSQEARILRYPNSSDTQITFVHAGDVYVVPIAGGLARKITSHNGLEMYPRFSPDGKNIAFSAEYDGNREIYKINAKGGSPERLTYSMDVGSLPERMGPDKIIMQWRDNNDLLFRSRSDHWHAWSGNLFTLNADKAGILPTELETGRSGYGYLSPDGNKIAYNRVFREYRTWKRYRGGQADDIWVYDFKSKILENITNNPAQDVIPMWYGNKIYFISDRSETMNLFVYDINSKQTTQVTNFTDYDVKFPSLGKKHIAFENGGYVYLLDLTNDKYEKVTIQINEDFPDARTSIISVTDKISAATLSPDGKRVGFIGRGDLFSVAADKGLTYQFTKTSGSHEREATWSPDGKWIAYISDKSGEDEIYLMSADGKEEKQLTNDAQSYRYAMKWSPDSKKILTSDKSLRLFYIDIDTKKTTVITKSEVWELRDYSWSPDSKWVTFTDYLTRNWPVVNIYNLATKKNVSITSEFFQSYSPVFTPGGKYLLFVSDRTFNADIGNFEWNFHYNNLAKIYGVTLQKDLESPFKPTDVMANEEAKKDDKKDDKKEDSKDNADITIDFDGIQNRIFEVPVEAGNYFSLHPTKDHKLYYVKMTASSKAKTYFYDFVEKEEKELGDFSSWDITPDAKNIIIAKGGNYYVEKLSSSVTPKNQVNTSEMKTTLNRREEWAQVYHEGWRQMKYFFYDPSMHGVDWDYIKTKYSQMLPNVNHRADLTYIMGEMIGELNIGHAYVGGGDVPKTENVGIGLLGAEYTFADGGYKIENIFEGRNWEEKTRSPLTEPGLGISKGDYIYQIDDVELTETISPYVALVGKNNKVVRIKVGKSKATATEKLVKTISNEAGLRYFNWVQDNLRKVDAATNGKIGYIHIPDMGVGNGLNEFVKYFYPQTNKEGLIIDDRFNGGGNVSPMIIERLKREIQVVTQLRNASDISGKPNGTMNGPVVCLINELSASDGDLFPYQFKQENLGTLIGKRSWGGVIGIRGSLPFLDGGYMMKPEFANLGANGEWILEGTGQTPDIEVDNHPDRELRGIDDQLNKAIEVILEQAKSPKKNQLPKTPPFPNKSKKK